jgi:hypothetical protein
MRPSTDRDLSDEEALAFWRHCVELELDQAVRQPLKESLRSMAMRGVSPFVFAHQRAVELYDPDKRMAFKLSHDTIMFRSGLGLGIIDPHTGHIRGNETRGEPTQSA